MEDLAADSTIRQVDATLKAASCTTGALDGNRLQHCSSKNVAPIHPGEMEPRPANRGDGMTAAGLSSVTGHTASVAEAAQRSNGNP
jgi:hypothetical protein